MRLAIGVVLGLLGAWLLWKAWLLVRVLLTVGQMPGEQYLVVASVIMALLATGLFYASWRLARPRRP